MATLDVSNIKRQCEVNERIVNERIRIKREPCDWNRVILTKKRIPF